MWPPKSNSINYWQNFVLLQKSTVDILIYRQKKIVSCHACSMTMFHRERSYTIEEQENNLFWISWDQYSGSGLGILTTAQSLSIVPYRPIPLDLLNSFQN